MERARYEAERARRQYDAVEPENRLVARTLERALEAKLAAQRQAEHDLLAARARRPVQLTEEELAWLSRAGADIRAVFHAPSTTFRERKQLLRAIVSEVVVTVDSAARTAALRIIWQGGGCTDLEHGADQDWRAFPRHRRGHRRAGAAAGRALRRHHHRVDLVPAAPPHRHRAAVHQKPGAVAAGLPRHPRLPAARKLSHADGDDAVVVTVAEAERLLGVSKVTIYRWLRDGFITGEQLTAGAPWRIRIDQSVRDRVVPTVPDGWVGLDEAASISGVARQTVLHKVQRGELQAVHVNRGQRKGLRIKVTSDQAGLFDQPS